MSQFHLLYSAHDYRVQVVKAADDRTLFGLLTLDTAIAVFDLTQHQAVTALALPGDRPLTPPLLSILEQGVHSHVMPLAQCRAQVQAAISSLRYPVLLLCGAQSLTPMQQAQKCGNCLQGAYSWSDVHMAAHTVESYGCGT